MANLTAKQQYYSTYDLIQEQIETLKTKLAEGKKELENKKHEISLKIHYGHAGDMLRVAHHLEELLEIVG